MEFSRFLLFNEYATIYIKPEKNLNSDLKGIRGILKEWLVI